MEIKEAWKSPVGLPVGLRMVNNPVSQLAFLRTFRTSTPAQRALAELADKAERPLHSPRKSAVTSGPAGTLRFSEDRGNRGSAPRNEPRPTASCPHRFAFWLASIDGQMARGAIVPGESAGNVASATFSLYTYARATGGDDLDASHARSSALALKFSQRNFCRQAGA